MARFFINIILEGYLLDKNARTKYQVFMDAVIWPSGIGRLPKNVSVYSHRDLYLIPNPPISLRIIPN